MKATRAILEAIEHAARERRVVEYGKPTARPAIDPASEKEFQSLVVAEAKRLGWKVYHTFDSRRCDPGFPDLIMLRGKRQIAAELKMAGNKPTEAQWNWLCAFDAAKVEIAVWFPAQWSEILDTLA